MRRVVMFKIVLFIVCFGVLESAAQPAYSQLHRMDQKDSLYYLLTDKALFKFYSHEASGQFYLTKYIEGNFPSNTKLMINDQHLFLSYNDTIFYYLNRNPWELDFERVFVPSFTISSLHGFGPYFFIRSGNAYHLFKIVNGIVISVEDSLFNHPSQQLVFFVYPFITIAQTVYKYIEGFDFYSVGQIDIGNGNTGLTGNTLTSYSYWVEPWPPGIYHSVLTIHVIEEPNFPKYTYEGWGSNINQLHVPFGWGTLIAKKNLYFMMWVSVITTYNSQLAYLPVASDRATITDYYIFLLGNDSLRYSRWNAGSTFYPFTWSDWTSVEENDQPVQSFELSQNFPNPFNPSTKIRYEITERSFVTIKVYDVLGNKIETLVNEEKLSGSYEVEFIGKGLVSGIYYYRITAGNFSQTKKMILLK
jgi:hypothetical protein